MKLLCKIGFHRFEKVGGTRVNGLFRQCCRCALTHEGIEGSAPNGERIIVWVKRDPDAATQARKHRWG